MSPKKFSSQKEKKKKNFPSNILKLLLIISLLNLISPKSELAENLQLEINNIAENFPEKWQSYFQWINSIGNLKIDKCNTTIALHRFKKIHKFSGEIINYFQDIIYAKSTYFKTFSFNVKKKDSDFTELIGAARLIGDQIEFAYIETITKSVQVPKYYVKNWTSCKFFLWMFPICSNHRKIINEAYTQDEIFLIYQTLRAHSYQHVSKMTDKILTALQSKHFVLSQNSEYFSYNDKYYLKVQHDGNLVLYKKKEKKNSGKENLNSNNDNNNSQMLSNLKEENEEADDAIWASQTYHKGNGPYMLGIEENGDMAIYDSDWTMLWIADFEKNENLPYNLEISNDGVMRLNDSKGNLMWKNGDKFRVNVLGGKRNLKFLE